jgi:GGDEF domain-containing protein
MTSVFGKTNTGLLELPMVMCPRYLILSELDQDLGESTRQAAAVAEKVRHALSLPYLLEPQRGGRSRPSIEHRCTVSIGVTLFVIDEAVQDDLLNRADVAMYHAKRSRRNRIRFYEGSSL